MPRRDPTLYAYLAGRFAGVRGVEIILDRRQGERRRESSPRTPDRRTGGERRQGRQVRHFLGYTFATRESPDD